MEIVNHDSELLKLALQNDQRGFTGLMEKYQRAIYNLVYKLVDNQQDSEDITIETFAKAFDNIHTYSNQFAFSTWIFKIASNTAIDFLRKKRIQKIPIDDHEGLNNNIIFSTNKTPELDLILQQRRIELHKYLNQLEPQHQQIIKLRFFEELSYEEISEKLNLSLANTKVQLHRAKKALTHLLAQQNEL